MYRCCVTIIVLALFLTICNQGVTAVIPLANLPPAEQQLATVVDPWGLAFSDQLARFQAHFADDPNAPFAMGVTHNLVKIWPNKYWFRGDTVLAGKNKVVTPIWSATGATASLQIAVLPRMGAAAGHYEIQVSAPIPVNIYREEFVKTTPVHYGNIRSEYWPDPLIPETFCNAAGVNLGVFLVEIPIPANERRKTITCSIAITDAAGHKAEITVPIRVVALKRPAEAYPLVAWLNERDLSPKQVSDMYRMALAHHLQPLMPGYLQTAWDPQHPEHFDAIVAEHMALGQRVFQIPEPTQELYQHIKVKGWLPYFMIYSNADEATAEVFVKDNIPYAKKMRAQFPGLKIFLACEQHPHMEDGCDRWLTDLSSSQYDPTKYVAPKGLELWHYYCHLPIGWQMRAPLVQAPNMQIDNPALEQRLACWMSWYYGAKGIFIYAGNAEWPPADFWQTLTLSSTPSPYPYGGCHNGNGFLVYPPREAGGPVLPSLRLKILRDAIDDLAILQACKEKYGRQWQKKMALSPDVFIHPHYWDQLPETLLKKREALLQMLAEG
jgi:hypothetical protein